MPSVPACDMRHRNLLGARGPWCLSLGIRILSNGEVIRISQSLGPGLNSCRLDSPALDTAVAVVEEQMSCNPHILVINNFRKHECSGRSFRAVIANALMRDIPVMVG
ncbi:DUF2478 domain-containing protein [Oricola nitratireducens]|uniref:DUF2478 domain-containing protein n=1 Tax=Oricola nitratireducens TaxID=2775868 RepID=UPI003D17D5E4